MLEKRFFSTLRNWLTSYQVKNNTHIGNQVHKTENALGEWLGKQQGQSELMEKVKGNTKISSTSHKSGVFME